MAKIVLDDVAGGYNLSKINSNFQLIEAALNNEVFYRDNPESTADSLITDLDANGRMIYNLPSPSIPSQAARLQDVQDAIAGDMNASLVSFSPSGGISSTNVQAAILELWNDFVATISASWAIPGTIGSTTPNTGAFTTLSTSSRATVERIRTEGMVTTVPTGVATTLFTINAGKHGLYDVVAYVNSSGSALAYTSIASIVWDGTNGRLVADNGSDLVLSLAGSAVQVLQASGGPLDVTWRYTYMG